MHTYAAQHHGELTVCRCAAQLITEALCDAGLRESEAADLQDQLAGVVSSIVRTAGPLLAQKREISFRLFWVLSHLLASSAELSIAHETVCGWLLQHVARVVWDLSADKRWCRRLQQQ